MIVQLPTCCRVTRARGATGELSAATAAEALLHIPIGAGLLLTPGIAAERQAGGSVLSLAAKFQWRM